MLYKHSCRLGAVLLFAVSVFFWEGCKKDNPPDNPVNPNNANCYIVSQAGTFSFPAVKGNTNTSVGAIASAEVLWETFGTEVAPQKGEVIASVSYADGMIRCQTPENLKNGNAVVAAKDAEGNILWSWHLWICKDYDPVATAQTYFNGAGVMMDRNLGATSALKGKAGSLGLLYQWGRKDPFLGGSGISSDEQAASTLSWPSSVESNVGTGTIDYAIKHPTTFITCNIVNEYGDWYYYTESSGRDNARWQSAKTIYDPCPPGWKVPEGGINGIWAKAIGDPGSFNYPIYEEERGMNFYGKFGSSSSIWIWYPASGSLGEKDCVLTLVGQCGYWWSCATYYSSAYILFIMIDKYLVKPGYWESRASAVSVRCVQE